MSHYIDQDENITLERKLQKFFPIFTSLICFSFCCVSNISNTHKTAHLLIKTLANTNAVNAHELRWKFSSTTLICDLFTSCHHFGAVFAQLMNCHSVM